jgi:site-specific recombinase XerD
MVRAGCPFSPYKLRHQFAFQLSLAGEPLEWQCDMMGHSPAVHVSYYKLFMKDLGSVRKIKAARSARF